MEMSIGTNIKSLRQQKAVTQEQLAEAMNVTCAAVSKWERGDTFPDITLLQPLAYYFGVSIDELMGYSAHKVEQTIEDLLERYRVLYRSDFNAARELIVQAHADYPNDYRIMHCYMWNLGGDYADNDPGVLLEHKDEFLDICRKIDDGCRDHKICLDAWNMRAKLLWAEGKPEEALEIYRTHFYNWYETVGQKSEQLFSKNTPEFLYWVKKNMYELAGFAADKLVKSIFFDPQFTMEKRVAEAEQYGSIVLTIAKETEEPFFAVIAHSLVGRLQNDLRYRGGTDADVIRMTDKYLDVTRLLTELAEENPVLTETLHPLRGSNTLLQWTVNLYLNAKGGRNAELLKYPEYVNILKKYSQE